MEQLTFRHTVAVAAQAEHRQILVGVVASGQLEVLVERLADPQSCEVEIHTAAEGFAATWQAVIADFVERHRPGGLKFSINDGGARPDMVALRLAQACHAMGSPV